MPKIVEYPLTSFEKVIKLAETVDYLGGSCSIPDCAAAMKKKVTGGFGILISSAIKHDVIIRRRDRLLVSDLYNKIKFSYNTQEKNENQRIAFLQPALYRKIWDRFHDKDLPVGMLDKLLIREFQVEADVSEKIAGFFMDGVRQLHLYNQGKLQPAEKTPNPPPPTKLFEETPTSKQPDLPSLASQPPPVEAPALPKKERARAPDDPFVVTIKGRGIDSSIEVHDQDDLLILEAVLGKIRKTL